MSRFVRLCGRIFLIVTCLSVVSMATQAAEPVTASRVQGAVEFRSDSNSQWQQVETGAELGLPVEIRTGPDSQVDLEQSATNVTLRSNTRVTLEPAEDQPNGLVETVRQWLGTVLYRVERRPDEFRVETPFLVSTVKGTEFVVSTTEQSSFVTLVEGSLEIEDLATGDLQLIGAGDIVEVSAGLNGVESLESAGADRFESEEDSGPGEDDPFLEELESIREAESDVLDREGDSMEGDGGIDIGDGGMEEDGGEGPGEGEEDGGLGEALEGEEPEVGGGEGEED